MGAAIADFVGRRILATTTSGFSRTVIEYRVLEMSPSGNYVRLMNEFGTKCWRLVTEVAVLEALVLPERCPRTGEEGP